MDIVKHTLYGGPNVGLYATAGNDYLLVPSGFPPSKAQILADILEVSWLAVSISGTRLLGALSVGNGAGILLPKTIMQDEYDEISRIANVAVLDSRYTALGNLVCANNRGALVSPLFDAGEKRLIADILDVEVDVLSISGYENTGALAVTNNTGTVVHPMTEPEEMDRISDILGTTVEPSTINNGVPYLSSGLLINDTMVVAGSLTTGPEIMMLTRAFLQDV